MKKTAVPKSLSRHNLPSELCTEILSRLPVKPILRFRCVSKSWCSSIDDPNFAPMHRANNKNNLDEPYLFVVQRPRKKPYLNDSCVVRASSSFNTTKRLGSFDTGILGDNWGIICSVDGLFMLQYDTPTLELKLWNPSIRKLRALPLSPAIPKGMKNVDLGFGFDPVINDYKHVRLVQKGERSLHSISIYTFGTGSWKTIGFNYEYLVSSDDPYSLQFCRKKILDWYWEFGYEESAMKAARASLYDKNTATGLKTVCFKGSLYFIATDRYGECGEEYMVSFDLSNEVFTSTSIPSDDMDMIDSNYASKAVMLVDGGRSLGVVYVYSDRGYIQVLENPDEWKQSNYMDWSEHFIDCDCIEDFVGYDPDEWKESKTLYLKKNGDLVLQWFDKEVAAHNFKTGDQKLLLANGSKLVMCMICGYKESLVLLNG